MERIKKVIHAKWIEISIETFITILLVLVGCRYSILLYFLAIFILSFSKVLIINKREKLLEKKISERKNMK